MGFFIFIAGMTTGLIIEAVAHFIFSYQGYIQTNDDDNDEMSTAADWINGSIIVLDFIIMLIIMIFISEMNLWQRLCFFISLGIGIVLSIIYIFATLFSSYGKYARLLNKIEKIENNIDLLRENKRDLTQPQRQAISLFEDASIKLKEQAHNILIMSSIKVAKNIELSNKNINIQRELDELEALQILNK